MKPSPCHCKWMGRIGIGIYRAAEVTIFLSSNSSRLDWTFRFSFLKFYTHEHYGYFIPGPWPNDNFLHTFFLRFLEICRYFREMKCCHVKTLMGCLVVALVCTQGAGHVTSCPLLHGDGAREMLAEGLLELWNHGPQETPRKKQSLISLEPDWLDIIGVSTCISGFPSGQPNCSPKWKDILNLSSLPRGAAFVFGMSVQGWHMTAASVLIQTAENCVPWEARQVQPMSLQLEDIRNLQRRETCCK